MSSFRLWIIHYHRNLLGTLIYCYLLASSVTGIIDDSNFIRYPAYKKTAHDLNKASFLRSLRSVLGIDGTGYIEGFTYPLTSRSAAMISGRGFRPGKRYDAEIISFM
uniref:Uncharacterized protein n=1 Tax=Onchocerca volvulus TaxID=6282 RepID=A0A2K6VXA1_ONCVO